MRQKYFFKNQRSIKKFVAGGLAAAFCAGAFSNYAGTTLTTQELDNIVKSEIDIRNYIKKEEIVSFKESNKIWGYDNNDIDVLKEIIKAGSPIYGVIKYVEGKVLEYYFTVFGKFKKEQYEEIQKKFKEKFSKDLDVKNVIFALFKSKNAVGCSDGFQFFCNNFTKKNY